MLYRFLARLFFLQLEQVCSYLQSLCGPAVSRRGSYNLGRRERRRMRLQIAELRVRRSRTRSADEERPVALCRITAREGHDDRHCASFASPQKNGNRLAGYGDLPFTAWVLASRPAKITCPTGRCDTEKVPETIRIPPVPDASAIALAGSPLLPRGSISAGVRVQRSGNRNQELQNLYLTPTNNPLPYGCG